jgi:hypothetical protein
LCANAWQAVILFSGSKFVTDKTFEVFIHALPKGKRPGRIVFSETIPDNIKNANLEIIAKLPQKSIQPVFICKDMKFGAHNYKRQRIHPPLQLFLPDGKDDALMHHIDTLYKSE